MEKGNSEKKEFIDGLIPKPLLPYLKNKRYMSIAHIIHQATAKPYGDGYMLDFIKVPKEFLKEIYKKGKSGDGGFVQDIYTGFNYDTDLPIPWNLQEGFPFVIKGTIWNSYNYPPNKHAEVTTDAELEAKCPATMQLFRHIYRDDLELGLDYATVEFMNPQQKLPVQVLFSVENKTAKSTILNQRKLLYGSNGAIIDSSTFDDKFNEIVVGKNFIGIDEGKLKNDMAMEKIKMRVTSSTIPYRAMRESAREVPNFGKWFIATNKENFGNITEEDSRFWMIQCYKIEAGYNPNFDDELMHEIPYWIGFLKYRWDNRFSKEVSGLVKMSNPKSKDRLWFEEDQYTTDVLRRVKRFNKSPRCKEFLDELIEWFQNFNNKLEASGQGQISYVEGTSSLFKEGLKNLNKLISATDIKRMMEVELGFKVQMKDGNISNVTFVNRFHTNALEGKANTERRRNVFKIHYADIVKIRDGEDIVAPGSEGKDKQLNLKI